jgi:hypothetical protein
MELAYRRLLITSLIVAAVGCKSADKPGETSYGFGGTLSKVLEAPLPETCAATMAGMRKLDLTPMEQERDAFRAMIVGDTIMGPLSQEQEVRVWLTRVSDNVTRIELKIIGRRDESRLKAILAEIEAVLPKKPAPTPTPAPAPQK